MNANTLEDSVDQYDSMIKEKAVADPNRRDPRWHNVFPSAAGPLAPPVADRPDVHLRRDQLRPDRHALADALVHQPGALRLALQHLCEVTAASEDEVPAAGQTGPLAQRPRRAGAAPVRLHARPQEDLAAAVAALRQPAARGEEPATPTDLASHRDVGPGHAPGARRRGARRRVQSRSSALPATTAERRLRREPRPLTRVVGANRSRHAAPPGLRRGSRTSSSTALSSGLPSPVPPPFCGSLNASTRPIAASCSSLKPLAGPAGGARSAPRGPAACRRSTAFRRGCPSARSGGSAGASRPRPRSRSPTIRRRARAARTRCTLFSCVWPATYATTCGYLPISARGRRRGGSATSRAGRGRSPG